jgi:hypothetical protein
MMLRLAIISAVCLCACGGAVDMDALCGDAPAATQGSLVTQVGCAYEQQTDTILHHGDMLVASVKDATGAAVASVQQSCGRYLMGKDARGVAVIIDTRTGAVRSHGMLHAGFPTSSLPQHLALPLSY